MALKLAKSNFLVTVNELKFQFLERVFSLLG